MLLLSLEVVLGEVAILAEAIRVVGLVDVLTGSGHLGFAFAMVAVVAHVLGVMLLVDVRALVDVPSFPIVEQRIEDTQSLEA